MQLGATPRLTSLRSRLGAAACLLIAAGTRSAAAADSAPKWQFDGAALLYGEKDRVKVIEPLARITRLFPDGQTLSATVAVDAITGASPTGAVPSGGIQTTTSASGNPTTHAAGALPVHSFSDTRVGVDLEWMKPFGWFAPSIGAHTSIESDYRSLGVSASASATMMQRLTTLSIGAGYNEDRVDPNGGTHAPLTDGTVSLGSEPNPKSVRSASVGISRIVTRRWLLGVNGSRSTERGYLTDPYKVISVLDTVGAPVGQLTESRPSERTRNDVLASSVLHLARDIVYLSYRYYWDDWSLTSHTADARYRLELGNQVFLQPHLRYYFQTRAHFFQSALLEGAPLPEFASSDQRLGDMRTMTVGLTYGFHPAGGPGELTFRAEYLRQWGGSEQEHEGEGEGENEGEREGEEQDVPVSVQDASVFPVLDIGSLVVSYSVAF